MYIGSILSELFPQGILPQEDTPSTSLFCHISKTWEHQAAKSPGVLWSYFFFQWVMIGHQFTAICCSTSTLVPDWWWPWGWTELDGPCLHDSQPAVHLFSNTVPSEAVTPCLCRIFCVSLAARLSIVMHFHFVASSGFCFIRQPTADGTRKGSWLAVV